MKNINNRILINAIRNDLKITIDELINIIIEIKEDIEKLRKDKFK